MNKKTTYPGFSLVISFGKSKNFKFEKDPYSIKIQIPFITIMIARKDYTLLLESYFETLLSRLQELEKINNANEIK